MRHDAAIDKEKSAHFQCQHACIQATNLIALAMSQSSKYGIAGKEQFRYTNALTLCQLTNFKMDWFLTF